MISFSVRPSRWGDFDHLTLCATQTIKTQINLPSCLHLLLQTDNDNLLLSGEEEHIVLSCQQSVDFMFEPCFYAELVRCDNVFSVFHYCVINDYFRVFLYASA